MSESTAGSICCIIIGFTWQFTCSAVKLDAPVLNISATKLCSLTDASFTGELDGLGLVNTGYTKSQ